MSGGDRSSGGSWFTWLLAVACVALALIVVVLARRTSQMQARIAQLDAELREAANAAAVAAGALQTGDALPSLDVVAVDGSLETLGMHGVRPTLLLVVSPRCEACDAAAPAWAELLQTGEVPASVRTFVVQIDRVGSGEAPPPVPGAGRSVVAANTPDSPLRRVAMTPAAVLIGPGGDVHRVWYGLPDRAALAELSVAATGLASASSREGPG